MKPSCFSCSQVTHTHALQNNLPAPVSWAMGGSSAPASPLLAWPSTAAGFKNRQLQQWLATAIESCHAVAMLAMVKCGIMQHRTDQGDL